MRLPKKGQGQYYLCNMINALPLPKPAGSEEIAIGWKQTHPISPQGISRSATANKKLKPFIKCSVTANSQLKRLCPTRWDRLDTQAIVANRAPTETAHLL